MKCHISLALPLVFDVILILLHTPTSHGFPLTQVPPGGSLTRQFRVPIASRTISTRQQPQGGRSRFDKTLTRGESTHLMSLRIDDPSTIMASMALLGSSGLGMKFDRWIPSSGIPVTLTVAAILSNLLPMVPISHPLYDLCWSWLLPGSLTLLLLGSQPTTTATNQPGKVSTRRNVILASIARVAGPFLLASIGSILGCWMALRVALANQWFASMDHARAAMSCLVASYIGGSVNLFATAKIIRAPTTLLSSMATADLLAMAVYFGFLASTIQWQWLRQGFFYQPHETQPNDMNGNLPSYQGDTRYDSSMEKYATNPINGLSPYKRGSVLSVISMVLFLTGCIVGLANTIETLLRRWIPGTACGAIAIVAPLLRSLLYPTRWMQHHTSLWNSMTSQGATLCFFLFFAAIGIGIDLGATIRLGPSCFLASLLALIIHLLVTILGSRFVLPVQKWGISLDHVWIASNAAIGGPATAAAFCNRLPGPTTNVVGNTMAATVWGVVGYAIGTVIGVGFFQYSGGKIV